MVAAGWCPIPESLKAPPPLFAVIGRLVDGAYVIRVQGELDVASAPEVRSALCSAITLPTQTVVVDLGEVSFLDSTGLQVLILAQRRLTRLRRDFVVACPPGPVRRLLEIVLVATLRVEPSLQAALEG